MDEDEIRALFRRMYPVGFAGADVVSVIAPDGWEVAPLFAVFHPSPQRREEERAMIERNLRDLMRGRKAGGSPTTPDPEEAAIADPVEGASDVPAPLAIDPEREIGELVTMCLWDVFSNNHSVSTAEGQQVDIGSFRGSAGFLSELLNEQTGEARYGYMDFYMSTIMVSGRADLTPVYRMIFSRMREVGLDWEFAFPRLHLIDFSSTQQDDWQSYEPSRAIAEQQEQEDLDRLRAELDADHLAAMAKARRRPPPAIVVAYRDVYGRLPTGWPPGE